MDNVYIIGHKNPDTDSICSAIAYADFKKRVYKGKYIPTRLGDPNNETKFVLDYFKIPVPRLIENVYTQLADISYDKPVNIEKYAPISKVWETMMKHNIKTVNVVDDNGNFVGIVSLGDIAKATLEIRDNFSNYIVPIENIITTLNGIAIHISDSYFSGNLAVAAMNVEDVEKRLSKNTLLIVGNREDVQIAAIKRKINTLITTGNFQVKDSILDLAKRNRVNIIKVPHDTIDAVRLINQSIPIHYVMKSSGLITFSEKELIEDVKEVMLKYKYRYFPVIENKKPVGLLTRRHMLDYAGKKVILVDHNEKTQSVEGLEQAQILEIIDHHRIGNIETSLPITFINNPVGCTATIIYNLYKEHKIKPSKSIAGIMCASILSDTLIFKSPTCTAKDIDAAKELSVIAEIDIDEFAKAMFEAGTSLKDKTEEDIFYMDFKEFSIGGYNIGVSQVNIYNTDLTSLKSGLLDFMENLRVKGGYDVLLLMLTDIINEGSEFLYVGDHQELLARAFDMEITGKSFYLPYVVSRKKQVIPKLILAINSL
ncbi:MAG: putative manganese-dependent inorganic diphosphatase [Tepidanaerobacteraceae bacterium]